MTPPVTTELCWAKGALHQSQLFHGAGQQQRAQDKRAKRETLQKIKILRLKQEETGNNNLREVAK